MKYAILAKPHVILFNETMDEYDDDLLCGWAVEVLDETEEKMRIRTHYGIVSYVRPEGFIEIDRKTLLDRNVSGTLLTVTRNYADVLAEPKYTAVKRATLPRGSFVTAAGEPGERYRPVELPDGTSGFIANASVCPRKDSDGYLLAEDGAKWLRDQPLPLPKDAFAAAVTATAKSYLGTQYRWGGKAPDGIDCSGLVFMSYMLNGYLVPRTSRAQTDRGFVSVPFDQLQPGDMIHASNPGHIMLSLGGTDYIHASSSPLSFGVSISSFDPESPAYMPGIRERVYACLRVK